MLGCVFLAAYGLSALSQPDVWDALFLGAGGVLYLMSVPWASTFHRGFAAVAAVALGVAVVSGNFDAGGFAAELPTYLGIVAVLLVLSIAGYPIRAVRYQEQIRVLLAALRRRGVATGSTAGGLGHLLGLVLDIGSLVLIDVVTRRAAPAARTDSLVWAARGFAFAPLWSNLNMLTVITITLTGLSYPGLVAAAAPFVVPGLLALLLVAQRYKGPDSNPPETSLDRGAAAVLAYPALLVVAVAAVSYLLPGTPLITVILGTVAVIVAGIALLATVASRQASPVRRLALETRYTLVGSNAEFALFGSAGIFVVSLTQLGALAPIGSLFAALDGALPVAVALFLAISLGFMFGIHSIPMVLLVNAAFPLDQAPAPELWTLAILLGNGTGMLLTPFSSTTAMLSRLTALHPLEVGLGRNWRFGLVFATAGLAYLTLLWWLLS